MFVIARVQKKPPFSRLEEDKMVDSNYAGQQQVQADLSRFADLIAPLKRDKQEWEASFTEEEKQKGAEFEESLKSDPEALMAFMGEVDAAFNDADANKDSRLDHDEFKAFVVQMNANGVARGLKNRDTTDEFINTVYPCFNGFNPDQEGVSKQEILYMLNLINQE